MRHSNWLANLTRTLAIVGVLSLGVSFAKGDEESDRDREQVRSAQNSDDDSEDSSDRSNRSSRDDESDRDSDRENRTQSNRNRQSEDDDREESSSHDERSDRSSRSRDDREDERSQRDARSREDRSQRSPDDRSSQRSRERDREVGAEFDTDDEGRLTVSDIDEDSLAARAGLREDDVIISVDGRRFADSQTVDRYLAQAGSRRVPIIIERDGLRYTVTLNQTLQSQRGWQQSQEEDVAWLGVYLDDNENGPVITQVHPQGPAARAGLRPGDVVVQFDGEDVTDSDELVEWIEQEDPHSRVDFTILRNDREMEVSATLASRNQMVYRGQNQGSQGFQEQYREERYTQQRGSNQDQRFQDERYSDQRDWNQQNRRQQNWNQDDRYADRGQDPRGYTTFSNQPRSGQQGDSSQRIDRLERMIRQLSDEVRDLRDQMEDNR